MTFGARVLVAAATPGCQVVAGVQPLPPEDAGVDARSDATSDATVADASDSGTRDAGPTYPPDDSSILSCAPGGPGLTTCGVDQNESCCVSPSVTGGQFYRSYGYAGDAATDASYPAQVSNYRLDKYLVTVGRFRRFVAAWQSGFRPDAGSGKHTYLNDGDGLSAGDGAVPPFEPGWNAAWDSEDAGLAPTSVNSDTCVSYTGSLEATWTDDAGAGHENLPINCVTWTEAYAFCIWDGAFLPSEAEWGYAAAGGAELREYPWGETDPGTDNAYAIYGGYYTLGPGPDTYFAPVGFAIDGLGAWGQLDLVGEVQEWVLDWYDYQVYVSPCVDCADTTAGGAATGARQLLGAAFGTPKSELEPGGLSYSDKPTTRNQATGFRCARAP